MRCALSLICFLLLTLAAQAESPRSQFEALLEQSERSFRLGHLELALQQRGQALDLARSLDNAALYALALFKSAQVHQALGHAQKAQADYLQCIRLFDQLQNPLASSQCYLELGNLFAQSGRLKRAVSFYGKAEARLSGSQMTSQVSKALLKAKLGKARFSGQPQEQTDSLSLEFLAAHPGPEAELWLGTTLLLNGQFNTSLALLNRARSRFLTEKNLVGFLRASLNLSSLHYRLGSTEIALDTIYQSLDGVPFDLELPKELEARLALLMMRLLSQSPERESWSQLARERLTGATRVDFLLSEIEYEIDKGHFGQAKTLLQNLHSPSSNWELARKELAMAQVALGEHELNRASQGFHKVLQRTHNQGLSTLAWRAHLGLGRALSKKPEQALEHYQSALDELEKIRGKLGQDELRTTFAQDKRPLYDEMILLLLAAGKPERAFEVTELARARARLDRRRRSQSAIGNSPAALNTKDLQKLLPTKVTALSYWVGSETVLLFHITRSTLKVERLDVSPQVLASLVSRVRPQDWYDARQIPSFDAQASSELYTALVPESGLSKGDTLLVLPDGPLHGLSFACLKKERYLIEDFAICYSPSLRVAASLSGDDASLSTATIYAGPRTTPQLPYLASESLGELPFAVEEAEHIKMFFPAALLRTGKEALESQFYADQLANPTDILHFATHSLVNPQNPRLSSLVLQQEQASGHDGVLLAQEIQNLRLQTKLVVLSSCKSGVGRLAGIEGVVGLVRAFQIAGAPQVVSTLWQISDRSTSHLMADFYEVLGAGRSVTHSLRAAQLRAINGEHSHPYQWAAFVANGTAW